MKMILQRKNLHKTMLDKTTLHKMNLQKTVLYKISSFMLCAILICLILPVKVSASYEIPGTCQVQTGSGVSYTVKTLDYSYDRNTYFSLRDLAMALNYTEKSFSLQITKGAVTLNPGEAYTSVGVENAPWEDSENPNIALQRNGCKAGGQDVRYYTLIMALPSGDYDCFMMAADFAMILDVDITVSDEGSLEIDTRTPFAVSPDDLEQAGYFDGVNGVMVGDATTGECYYRYRSGTAYPIASTSKLMTCLLTMDAITAGQLSLEQTVTISEAAEALAVSGDGELPLKAGEEMTVHDLLVGALLPSSNECALCLAEAVAGSENAFVQMMNQKAAELGLSQAVFYNCNGLPFYTKDPVPAKRQNRMSADDMFLMVSYLLKVYPQIKEITSLETAPLYSLGIDVKNTNPILHNLPGVTGLKTGTTNKSGACLVTSLSADDGVMEHDLVIVVLGTEDSIERGRVSELLGRYALRAFDTGEKETEAGAEFRNLPMHAEAAVDWVLRTARQH